MISHLLSRRNSLIAVVGLALVFTAACSNKKAVNPLGKVNSKQPDKVLFDKAMEAMKRNRFDVARMTLQTLINTYPDSEFIARAKLAVGDSWYAEGGTASLAQAEQEYRDFQTFFPNMPEAAEAQLKIANIQYQQMEKADRDYTHAKRAEDEYRNLIMQYPDNAKLVAEGKQRLLEVQEVLAEREFEIGKFYYMKMSYAASIARLQSLVDKYPLYSRADEALYLLGQNYEGQIARIRSAPSCSGPGTPPGCVGETFKANLIAADTKEAASRYAQIITRYPIMDRVDDAKSRLEALHQPIPRPTKADVARNKAEDDSRHETGAFGRLTAAFMKHPDVGQATKFGEPQLSDPTPIAASDETRKTLQAGMGTPAGGEKNLGVEVVKNGAPPPNDAPPRSDAPPANANSSPFARPTTPADSNELKPPAAQDSNDLKPDPNELKPTTDDGEAVPPPPAQVNEIEPGHAVTPATASSGSELASDKDISTSKKKKKKGIRKIVPF
ncbi:MAG TPA: outer membrane protein assembly factor BamD [Candidatus Sulfotelmatobacter sp.]